MIGMTFWVQIKQILIHLQILNLQIEYGPQMGDEV